MLSTPRRFSAVNLDSSTSPALSDTPTQRTPLTTTGLWLVAQAIIHPSATQVYGADRRFRSSSSANVASIKVECA